MRSFLGFCLAAAVAGPALADTLIVDNKQEATVSFIDLDSGEEVARSKTGRAPHEIALSPDGALAVVVSYIESDYVGKELNLFDVGTAALARTISLSPHEAPHGIEWLGDSQSVLVTTERTRDVIKVDVAAGKVTAAVATGGEDPHLMALSPDGQRAYVTDRGANTVSVIDVPGMTLLDTAETNQGPEGIDVSPDGRTLWVGNNDSHDIVVCDAHSMQRSAEIAAGFDPIRVRFHPDGAVVAVADLNGARIVIYDATTGEEIAAVDLSAADARSPASLPFSPDGARLYTGAQQSARVVEIDSATWTIARTFEVGQGPTGSRSARSR